MSTINNPALSALRRAVTGRIESGDAVAIVEVPAPHVMPPHPHTGLLNVTHEEVADALAATEDVTLVRPDGTLTPAGQVYVADVRRFGHEECDECSRRKHSPIMTGAGTPPLCSCGWQGKRHEGPILADHLREVGAL